MQRFSFFFGGIFFVLLNFAFSQDNLNFQFEESELQEMKPQYFGLGGGYLGSFSFVKLDDIKGMVLNDGLDEIKSPIFLSGAEGFTAIGIIPNIRIGFFGYSGSKVTERTIGDSTKGVSYELEYMGFAVDYGFILFKSFALLPGFNLGWSGINIERYLNRKEFDWNELNTNGSSNRYFFKIDGKFWFVEPKLSIEYAVTPFLMVRAALGYPVAISKDWKLNRNESLLNVPSSLNTTGLKVQLGIFVGLFNY